MREEGEGGERRVAREEGKGGGRRVCVCVH